jgi:hypothetical protein
VLEQHLAKRLVGKNAGEIIDAAIATAITSSAPNLPAEINASRPLASCTVFSSTFATSIAII